MRGGRYPGHMELHRGDVADFVAEEAVRPFIDRMCVLFRTHPFLLEPYRGIREETRRVVEAEGLRYYSTVKRTTLFYDPMTDCFLKMVHPWSVRDRVVARVGHPARWVFDLSERLRSLGVPACAIAAFGEIREGRVPFHVSRRVTGHSFFEAVREGTSPSLRAWRNLMAMMARVHGLGYWFRDAHLSDFFLKDDDISGIIDINSMRPLHFFHLRSRAKDVAGVNHPDISLTDDRRETLIDMYTQFSGIRDEERFGRLVSRYTRRRWYKCELGASAVVLQGGRELQ